jgi:methionine aminopeptidase
MKLHDDHRKDWRNDEQFARDILTGHKVERSIIEKYANYLETVYGIDITIKDNGVDNTGEVIDSSQVSADADYMLNDKLIEVKYINKKAEEFRLKESQVKSYIRQEAYLLFVNGWETDEPRFTLLDTAKLNEITRTVRPKPYEGWGYKKCYLLKSGCFDWYSFI